MNTTPSNTHPLRSSAALFATAAIWGLAFVAQRVAFDSFGPFTFNGLRFLLGALSLLPLTFFLKPSGLTAAQTGWKPVLLPGLVAGGVLFTAAGFQQAGLEWTTAGKAAFLTGFYILLVPIFGLFLRRPAHRGVWIGAVLGLTGLYFLSITAEFTMEFGDLLQLCGAVFWALHILVIDRFVPRMDPIKLALAQFVVCGILSLGVGLTLEPWHADAFPAGLVPLLYGGLASVGIAYTLQLIGQRGVAPGPAALIMSLETVFAALGGWWLLGEQLGARELLGCALMLVGMVAAQITWRKK